ncbi:MAG: CPBP family intramembrane metalloprotease [Treponema sp.]|jgi:membrane protease YdiL (CAAX protease family)|nr:CPBP family intramembrane metalloprotease [Treponema sp.]
MDNIPKRKAVKDLVQALALFFILFFPRAGTDTLSLSSTFFFRLPAFALLVLAENRLCLRPYRRDILVCGAAFTGLVLIGIAASAAAAVAAPVAAPHGAYRWTAALAGLFCAAYLEEGYFRVYLPGCLGAVGAKTAWSACLASALIFALCHAYEGPWGVVNALVSGVFLSAVYMRGRSFHGIALAHGLYNTAVLVYAAISK